jgi:hypothetical protein
MEDKDLNAGKSFSVDPVRFDADAINYINRFGQRLALIGVSSSGFPLSANDSYSKMINDGQMYVKV